MAKYSELTQGQIEAVINKLGGMLGLKYFLSDGTWTANHKDEIAYSRGFDSTRALRDLLRGWGKYETKDNSGCDIFSVLLSNVTDRSTNLSRRALEEHSEVSQEICDSIIDKIDELKRILAEFRVRENIPFELEGWLNRIRDGLRQKDYFKVFETAAKLRGYVTGVEWHNDLMHPVR